MDSEDVSPNKVNPFQPRYAKLSLVNLSEVVKPDIYNEEMCICNCRNDRGGWGGRASKEQKGAHGKSDGRVELEPIWEYITMIGASRMAEGTIVALKEM